VNYSLWKRSRIAWSLGWEDTGQVFASADATYEETGHHDYVLMPEGTVPVDARTLAFEVMKVTVPKGGFLAVRVRGLLGRESHERLEKRMGELMVECGCPFKALVFGENVCLTAVGPEKESS
jgi:hypothetical protein